LIGAAFLDGGYAAAADMVGRLWGERLRTPARPLRDPKTVLQEWAQARGLPTPSYREISRSGPHHDPEFLVAVNLPELTPAEGMGRSKRAAEQAAAAAMLSREGVQEGAHATPESVKEHKEGAKQRVRNRGAKDGVAKGELKDSIGGDGVEDSVKAAAAS
jgi:hypothetical protein